ncbi:MAG: alpha/beta fold hydrolase, partial [Candidatus Nitrotoga sp.]
MHGGMWGDAVHKLAQHFTVHCLDLPGHGASGNITPYNLDTLASSLSEHARKHFSGQILTVCGWSLGGQIALRWAKHMPQQVQRLILVTSTPCFVQRANWLCAMPRATFQAFEQDLQMSPERTLKRFISLQVRGSEQEQACLAHLRSSLLNFAQPDHSALRDGLAILRETDLRASLPHIKQSVLVIAGECDELIPALASEYLALHLPN